MSNNKKTKKQKIIADLRHKLTLAKSQSTSTISLEDTTTTFVKERTTHQYTFSHSDATTIPTVHTFGLEQLHVDLKHTLLTSFSIFLLEMILFFILQHQIVRLFNLNY